VTGIGLSLCMIVKDEEAWIARCLASVRGVVDEIIVVDTGSTDRTREICESFGAKVFDFPWNDHFADARNFSLEQATGSWIFWLDADEEVDAGNASALRSVLDMEDTQLAFIELINYYGEGPPAADRVYRIAHHRLFRSGIGFRFHNAIHEQLNVDEVLGEVTDIPILPVKVHHYGYLDAVTAQKGKSGRNLSLLQLEAAKPEHDPWIDYHLASEYYRLMEYRRAFEQVNQSIVLFLQNGITPPSMLYKLKYAALLSLNSFDGAWPAVDKAIALYPDYVDLHFYKGVALLQLGMLEEAVQTFSYCLLLGEGNLKYLTLKGVGSFEAWYYLGLCCEKQGRPEAAVKAYKEALMLAPDHSGSLEALRRIQAGV